MRLECQRAGLEQGTFQQLEQEEVREMVCAELSFETVFGAAFGRGHYAGVVDEDIESVRPSKHLLCSSANGIQRINFHLDQDDLGPVGGIVRQGRIQDLLPLFQIPDCQKELCSGCVKGPNGLCADTSRAACDEYYLVSQSANKIFVFKLSTLLVGHRQHREGRRRQ